MTTPKIFSDEWFRSMCLSCHFHSPDPRDCTHLKVREVAAAALEWAADEIGLGWIVPLPIEECHITTLRAKAKEVRDGA